jgi:hypothetical protein
MADAVAHGRTVLTAVTGGGGSLAALDYAAAKLPKPERYFTDPVQRVLFELLTAYSARFGGVMSREALGDLLRGKKPGTAQMYGEAYDAVAAAPLPEDHEFRHAVHQLRELAADRATGEALATGEAILRNGAWVDDQELRGHAAAREFVLAALADAEQLGADGETPEGNVAAEGAEVLAAYAEAKALREAGKPVGVQFGLPPLDGFLGGLGKGLCLVVAGTTVGKSSICVQCAWHNAVMEGRNVLFFTTEQHRTEVRIKLVARHSCHPKFGLRQGLDTARIRSGRLSPAEEKILDWVLSDLKGGPYGEIQVVQMPEHCTVSVMAGRAESMARRLVPDLMVFDYLQLMDPERRTRDSKEHENQSGIVKGAHRWAQTAFHGRGVPLISPWQTNRSGMAALKSGGGFSLDEHMSQSSEAAKTAGTVLALAAREEDTSRGRRAPLVLSVEKNRDGARGARFELTADYATSCFADREVQDEDPISLDF